jgi:hypothetical protein
VVNVHRWGNVPRLPCRPGALDTQIGRSKGPPSGHQKVQRIDVVLVDIGEHWPPASARSARSLVRGAGERVSLRTVPADAEQCDLGEGLFPVAAEEFDSFDQFVSENVTHGAQPGARPPGKGGGRSSSATRDHARCGAITSSPRPFVLAEARA